MEGGHRLKVPWLTPQLCHWLCVLDQVKLLLCALLPSAACEMIYQGASEKQNNLDATQRQTESSIARKKKKKGCVKSHMGSKWVGTESLPESDFTSDFSISV